MVPDHSILGSLYLWLLHWQGWFIEFVLLVFLADDFLHDLYYLLAHHPTCAQLSATSQHMSGIDSQASGGLLISSGAYSLAWEVFIPS